MSEFADFLLRNWHVIPAFVFVLSVVVFVHEYGHYWVARRNGVRIETFSIGFGRELFGTTDRNGTRWKFALIPLGGYVKMLGDADATSATVDRRTVHEPESFPSKTVWQRMAVVAAGPLANFLFGIVLLTFLFAIEGRRFTPPQISDVQQGSAAAAAGLLAGDRIVNVDDEPIESFEELQTIVSQSPEVPLRLTVEREGEPAFEVTVTPRRSELVSRFGTQRNVGLLGVSRSGVEFRRSSLFMAPIDATVETARMIGGTLWAIGEMIMGYRGTEELGGPLRIAHLSGELAAAGPGPLAWFIAILSINLGLINLFPIPMLDGGHLMMYSIEASRGRPLTERSQEIAFRFGLAMVLTLMVFAFWNDAGFFGWIRAISEIMS